jgi:hypothetical protein
VNKNLGASDAWIRGGGTILDYLKLHKQEFSNLAEDELPRLVDDLKNLLDRCANLTLWNSDNAKADVTLGHVCKHEMCTYIVKLIYRAVGSEISLLDLKYLIQKPVFPHEKFDMIQRFFSDINLGTVV